MYLCNLAAFHIISPIRRQVPQPLEHLGSHVRGTLQQQAVRFGTLTCISEGCFCVQGHIRIFVGQQGQQLQASCLIYRYLQLDRGPSLSGHMPCSTVRLSPDVLALCAHRR